MFWKATVVTGLVYSYDVCCCCWLSVCLSVCLRRPMALRHVTSRRRCSFVRHALLRAYGPYVVVRLLYVWASGLYVVCKAFHDDDDHVQVCLFDVCMYVGLGQVVCLLLLGCMYVGVVQGLQAYKVVYDKRLLFRRRSFTTVTFVVCRCCLSRHVCSGRRAG